MKKRISLLLAVVMILGSFSFAFAANDEVDPGKFLEQEGVLKGDTTGDLMLDKPLERRDSVILLSRLFGEEKEAKEFAKEGLPTWEDNNDGNYKGYLAWAQSNEYFQGHSEAKFGPRENITVKEYSIVLLRALGYNEEAGLWKTAYETAKKQGILEGVEKEADVEVLREEMAQMTFNALGLNMKGENKTLAEKLGIEMPAPAELKAEVKDTENLKEVVVNLSNAKLAKQDKLENASNYRISGYTIERVEVKDNDVILQVKDTFRSGKQYELQIKGVDKAVDGKYKFIARDNTIPSVEKVEVLGEYGVKVITSEPIEDVRGKNFSVDGKYTVMNVETYGRNLILTPYNGSFSSDAKTLTIEGLKDFAGYKSAKEDFEIEIAKDNEAPKVEDVILKGNKVEVVFDKDIYKDSVDAYYSRSSAGNISYELGRHTIYANKATKVDTNRVAYEFKDAEAPSRRDSVTIVDVTNHSKVKMEKTTMAVREVLDDIEPEIVEKKMIAKDTKKGTATIKLTFDKDVTGDLKKNSDNEFNVDSHVTLYENEVYRGKKLSNKVESVKYDYDEKEKEDIKDVIIVELKGLEIYDNEKNDLEYVLEIEGFADAASTRNKMYRDYYEFKFEKGTSFAIKDIAVVTKGKRDTTIEIEFSKALDRDIAEDATNYIFYTEKAGKKTLKDDVADLEGEAILKSNGKVVRLEIPEGWDDLKDDYAGLKVVDTIKDKDGNRLADYNTIFNFAAEKIENPLKSAEDIAKFKEDHEKALELKVADVKANEHRDIVTAALTAYGKLSDDAKEGLEDEYEHLKKLDAAIKAQDEVVAPLALVAAKETVKPVAAVSVTPASFTVSGITLAEDDVLTVDGVEIKITDATDFAKNVTNSIKSALLAKDIEFDGVNTFENTEGRNFDWTFAPKTGTKVEDTTKNGVEKVEEVKQQVELAFNKNMLGMTQKDDVVVINGTINAKVISVSGNTIVIEASNAIVSIANVVLKTSVGDIILTPAAVITL